MAEDFLSALLGNANRARLLRIFVLNQTQAATLSQVAKRASVPPGAALREVKALERAGVIRKSKITQKRRKTKHPSGKTQEQAWIFNSEHEHAAALSQFVHSTSPIAHRGILDALKGAGRLSTVVLSGVFMGDMNRAADLIVALDGASEGRLEAAVKEYEQKSGREIRYAVFSTPEFRYRMTVEDRLMRDVLDYPHVVLLDRTRLLEKK